MTTSTEQPKRRGPYAKSADTRRAIVEACADAFGETGFHGATMADIARRAEISHTGLLHHFPSKELLLTEVLQANDERTAEFLAAHAGAAPATADAAISGLIWVLLQKPAKAGLAELGAALSGEAIPATHPAHDYFAQRYAGVRHFLGRQLAVLRERGEIASEHDDETLAAMMIALVEGLQKQQFYDPSIDVANPVIAFWKGLATSG